MYLMSHIDRAVENTGLEQWNNHFSPPGNAGHLMMPVHQLILGIMLW